MVKSAGPVGLERIELRRLMERVTRLLTVLQEISDAQVGNVPGAWTPPVDVCETANAICVRIEVPGVMANQIKIGLNNSKLCVYGEKRKPGVRKRVISHHCSERSYGHFKRIVPLHGTIAVGEATAELANGVLMIRLPKIKDRRGSEFHVPIIETE